MRKYFSNYGRRPSIELSHNNGVVKVEKAGYRPAYMEIAAMIASGDRFEAARQFDYPDEASIEKGVNHVNMSDMDKFEMIDYARNTRLQIAQKLEAQRVKKVEEEREATRKKIIEDYEKAKAVQQPAEASPKAGE